ncbi:MAG: hypothetical protein ACXWNW_06830, partial [Isosphaeraceae bacterium]
SEDRKDCERDEPKEQIQTQHLEQLLGASAIEAEIYRQRLPQRLAERKPEETEQEIDERHLASMMPPTFRRSRAYSRPSIRRRRRRFS